MTTFYLLVVILLNGGGQVMPFRTLDGCVGTVKTLYLEVITEVKCYKVTGNFDILDFNFDINPSFAPQVSPLPTPKGGHKV